MRTETKYVETGIGADYDTEVREARVVKTEDQEVDGAYAAVNAVYAISGIIIGLISLRFVLLLLGANPQNSFASIIYSITEIFVSPFYGLFGNTYDLQAVRFELESLISIITLSLVSWGISRILLISKPQQD